MIKLLLLLAGVAAQPNIFYSISGSEFPSLTGTLAVDLTFLKHVERHYGECSGCNPPRITVMSTEFNGVSTEQAHASLSDSVDFISELTAAACHDAFPSYGIFSRDCPSLGGAIETTGPLTIIVTSGLHGPLALLRDNTAFIGFEDGTSRVILTSDLYVVENEQRYAIQYLKDVMSPELDLLYIPPGICPCSGQITGMLAEFTNLSNILATLYAYEPSVIPIWVQNEPWLGAATAECFDLKTAVRLMETIYRPGTVLTNI